MVSKIYMSTFKNIFFVTSFARKQINVSGPLTQWHCEKKKRAKMAPCGARLQFGALLKGGAVFPTLIADVASASGISSVKMAPFGQAEPFRPFFFSYK